MIYTYYKIYILGKILHVYMSRPIRRLKVDFELGELLDKIRIELENQGHSNPSYSNAIRSLADLPHNQCSCTELTKRGRRKHSEPTKNTLKTLVGL
jgi:hypothetical protein